VTVRHSVYGQRGNLYAAEPESICIGSRHSEALTPAMRHLRFASMARRYVPRNNWLGDTDG